MSEDHECKQEVKLAEMHTDIKWLRRDTERRNGHMDDHLKESESFRRQVRENSTWRKAFIIVLSVTWVTIGVIVKLHLN